mgnify:CR=1 FL=1|tara:strand:+ start:32 stop:460 length:429 start_codon:yes stop_codon:yes gene_type:complete
MPEIKIIQDNLKYIKDLNNKSIVRADKRFHKRTPKGYWINGDCWGIIKSYLLDPEWKPTPLHWVYKNEKQQWIYALSFLWFEDEYVWKKVKHLKDTCDAYGIKKSRNGKSNKWILKINIIEKFYKPENELKIWEKERISNEF